MRNNGLADMNEHNILIDELIKLLEGGSAHATFEDAVAGLSHELLSVKPDDLPYSIWQLVEHIRIAQWDMLEFSRDANHQSPKWPDDYWPKEAAPADEEAWNKALAQIKSDREEFIELLRSGDIYKALEHGDGQSILHEALQIADHNSYHTAEIILIRRLLKAWK
ncbi:DinB family protein [Mucilaginibacter sp. RS28]|uniref:DinB family protein n=1 Tax=Mucilaginibacter straminoryzae TaxID=2932774 RepID=A0A9X1X534_9SPHI|nr:DinB family protein [Mucilaginibacter straminoryzae]MCJ8209743.1 DinB family protein [Mucilaginibacter straminoryzae]